MAPYKNAEKKSPFHGHSTAISCKRRFLLTRFADADLAKQVSEGKLRLPVIPTILLASLIRDGALTGSTQLSAAA